MSVAAEVRRRNPVILNLTNFVAMEFNANALLAIGASPIMAHAPEELDELIALAGAVVINIGTLDKEMISSMHRAIVTAEALGTPVVLDPVGCGATQLRTQTAQAFLKSPAVRAVRGNASEVLALFYQGVRTRGVDATVVDPVDSLKQIAIDFPKLLVASGEVDHIFYGDKHVSVTGGDAMATKVTGVGCSLTAVLGAYLAVSPEDPLTAATEAMQLFKTAAERARKKSQGPGSFKSAFIDELANEAAF